MNLRLLSFIGLIALLPPITKAATTVYTNLSATAHIIDTDAVVLYRGTNPPFVLWGSNWLSRVAVDSASYTNCCGTGTTNLASTTVPAHTMTNTGDGLRFFAAGRMANSTASTNQLKAIWGWTTILDTGSLLNSNTTWFVRGEIIRTGNTNAVAYAEAGWIGGGQGFHRTNAVTLAVWETNGIATALTLQAGSTKPAGVTQEVWRVERMR